MTDVHDTKTRSKNMAAVKTAGTQPERLVEALLREMELAFSSQETSLPGKPDFYLPQFKTVIFVHGCYWHGHHCHLFKTPQTRTDFWINKINQNRQRDHAVHDMLNAQNVRSLTIWECALRGSKKLERSDLYERIEEFILTKHPHCHISHSGFSL